MSFWFHFSLQLRRQLTLLQDDLRKRNQLVQKDPETTIKGGALKADRKTKRTPVWMDDLACLEKLTEVRKHCSRLGKSFAIIIRAIIIIVSSFLYGLQP